MGRTFVKIVSTGSVVLHQRIAGIGSQHAVQVPANALPAVQMCTKLFRTPLELLTAVTIHGNVSPCSRTVLLACSHVIMHGISNLRSIIRIDFNLPVLIIVSPVACELALQSLYLNATTTTWVFNPGITIQVQRNTRLILLTWECFVWIFHGVILLIMRSFKFGNVIPLLHRNFIELFFPSLNDLFSLCAGSKHNFDYGWIYLWLTRLKCHKM